MKHLFIIASALLLMLVPLEAGRGNFSAVFSPQRVWLNEFNTASFDPGAPDIQPILTNLTITNNGPTAKVRMKLEVMWNSITIIGSEYISKDEIMAGGTIPLTNRDLITTEASDYFATVAGTPSINLDDILNSSTVLKNAVLSGYFPDGDLLLRIYLSDDLINPVYGSPVTFTITVRNSGVIHLVSPGNRIGNIPPQVSMKPVSFVWNAINTGFNRAWISIREFNPANPPNAGSVATGGNLFYETPDDEAAARMAREFNFAEFLAFNEGHFYAWQITMDRFTETNPNLQGLTLPPSKRPKNIPAGNTISSIWHVFKYVSDASTTQNANEIQALLNQLNNQSIQNLFNAGFAPTGLVNADGRNFTGSDAVKIVEELIGKQLEIKVGN